MNRCSLCDSLHEGEHEMCDECRIGLRGYQTDVGQESEPEFDDRLAAGFAMMDGEYLDPEEGG